MDTQTKNLKQTTKLKKQKKTPKINNRKFIQIEIYLFKYDYVPM